MGRVSAMMMERDRQAKTNKDITYEKPPAMHSLQNLIVGT